MPRRRQPPRLYLREDERVWIIRDGASTIRTGCGELDRDGAEKALASYLTEKFTPAIRASDPRSISVAEVLTAYGREHAPTRKAPQTIGYAIAALVGWWGSRLLTDVRGATCRAYAEARRAMTFRGNHISDGTVRRELGVLAAAINHFHREHGPLDSVPVVSLPPSAAPRERFLTRQEAARLLAGALGWYKVSWSDLRTRAVKSRWIRDRAAANPHTARFILLGLYTGTRHGAILGIQWMANTTGGWVDLDRGVMHRRGQGVVQTKKRTPPTKVNARLMAHLRRWKRIDDALRAKLSEAAGQSVAAYLHVVAWDGQPIQKLRRSWDTACDYAGLGADVTPHTLRHTRATWLMQAGVDVWEAAGSIGMSAQTLERVYGHHHPDFQKKAAQV